MPVRHSYISELTSRPSEVRSGQFLMLVTVLCLSTGCGHSVNRETPPPDIGFLNTTRSKQSASELQSLVPYIRGNRVSAVDEICARLEQLPFAFTCADAIDAFSFGDSQELSALPLSDYLSRPQQTAGLVVNIDGSIGVVLQTGEVNGKAYAAFVQGPTEPYLVNLTELRDSKSVVFFTEEIQPSKFSVGGTSFEVDRLVHDAGIQKPFGQLETQFKIHNLGPDALFVASPPKSSCSCTVGKMELEKSISPGETRTLDVIVRTKDKSFRQPVLITLMDRKDSIRKAIGFQVVGVVPTSMHVQPTSIRFTEDIRDRKRTVHLSEVAEDRFEILGATLSSSVPGDVSIEKGSVPGKADLAAFAVSTTLPEGCVCPAGANGELIIRTTSALRPTIRIAIYVPPMQRVTAIPATVVFGSVNMGDAVSVTKTVTFQHSTSEIRSATILSVPDGVTADLVNEEGEEKLRVGVSSKVRSGLLNDSIRVQIHFGDEEEQVDVKCVGLFR